MDHVVPAPRRRLGHQFFILWAVSNNQQPRGGLPGVELRKRLHEYGQPVPRLQRAHKTDGEYTRLRGQFALESDREAGRVDSVGQDLNLAARSRKSLQIGGHFIGYGKQGAGGSEHAFGDTLRRCSIYQHPIFRLLFDQRGIYFKQAWDAPKYIRVTDDENAPQFLGINQYGQHPHTGQCR